LKNQTEDEWVIIKAVITSNETGAPNISIAYIPLRLKSDESLTGPKDYINLNIVVAILAGCFVLMVCMISALVLKLVKFGTKGEEPSNLIKQKEASAEQNNKKEKAN